MATQRDRLWPHAPSTTEDEMAVMIYRPDPYITAGANWARGRGIPNHCISVRRVGDHAHVANTMFDHSNLAAVVAAGKPGYATHVEPGTRCAICHPHRFVMSYDHTTGKPGLWEGTWEQLQGAAKNALLLNFANIEVRDETGRDVTFEVPAFIA